MIPYEELCAALEQFNRKRRGEALPPSTLPARRDPTMQVSGDDLEILESEDVGARAQPPHPEFGSYESTGPMGDVTAETELPEAMPDPRHTPAPRRH
jgi:hypothetical protein